MTPSHVNDTVKSDVAMCIPLLSQTPIVCRTPRSKSPRCHAHSGVKKTNFFKNSALSCSRRSQAPRCHAHCGVWLHRVMLTAECDFTVSRTPRSQNAHRRVRIENFVGLYMLRGENILCIKNGISHYLNRLACRCHAHRTASLSGVQMGYRVKKKWGWKLLWYTYL